MKKSLSVKTYSLKNIGFLIGFLTVLTLFFVFTLSVSAANEASLSGTSQVRPGDSITLTFSISGSDIYGFTASLDYDSSKLSLTNTSQKIASPWMVEFSSVNIIAYDNSQNSPINSSKSVFTATFKVSSSLSVGSEISVSVKNIVATAGTSDIQYGSASYSASILPPMASDSSLSSLTVSNADISPAFSPSVYKYTATVPFSVSSLKISAKTNDSSASYSVYGKSLTVGYNTTQITVTAENGSQTVYTINVTREQDPNYISSDNALLSELSVSSGVLSPAFSPEIKDYIVYLPFENKDITVSAVPSDMKANDIDDISMEIIEGDNIISVVCIAEDGVSKQTYTVHVLRMTEFIGTVPMLEFVQPDETGEESSVATDFDDDTAPDTIETPTTELPVDISQKSINSTYYLLLTLAVTVVSIGIGLVLGLIIKKRK